MTGLRPEGFGRLTAAGYVPTGETTHYDLCVAGAPSNHVRCASLRSGGDSACGAEGCGLPLCGNAYKVSVTGFPFLYHMTCFPPGGKGTGFAGSRRRLRIQRHASQRTRWWRQPPKGDTPEWYMKYMTRCFFPHISRFPLRGQNKTSLHFPSVSYVAHCPVPIVPPATLGERWCRKAPKGGSAGVVREEYGGFSPVPISCFPLRERPRRGKGCTRQSTVMTLYREHDRRKAAFSLSSFLFVLFC